MYMAPLALLEGRAVLLVAAPTNVSSPNPQTHAESQLSQTDPHRR